MLGVKAYIVQSQDTGFYEKGLYVQGKTSKKNVQMSVQPWTAEDRSRNPEGDIIVGDLVAYSKTALRVSSQEPLRRADWVKFGQFWYEVKDCRAWTMGRLSHYRHVLCRVVNDVTA